MQIHGLNKTTLLDYPGHVAATVFTGGCNFRCPFCQNGDLVLRPESQPQIKERDILDFLKKRKGILTGVCITGGEPTLDEGLTQFIYNIKEIGYLVKLDTNGYRPEILKELLKAKTPGGKLLDYIAMDIKSSMNKYGEASGAAGIDIEKIRESIKLIMESKIEYEFRTTIVKELHRKEDMKAIGEEIRGAKAYFLQGYQESDRVIAPGFHPCTKTEMKELAETVRPFVCGVKIRGVDGIDT